MSMHIEMTNPFHHVKLGSRMTLSCVVFLFVSFLVLHVTCCAPRVQAAEVKPANYAVIINQMRGEECCSPGSLANTKMQLETAIRLGLPTTFVLRYDALTDRRYTDLISFYKSLRPDLINVGVMVEIVPSLIEDTNSSECISQPLPPSQTRLEPSQTWSPLPKGGKESEGMSGADNGCGLEYKGSEATWFQAQNAFTIGYPIESRRIIVDTLIQQYKSVFGTYPTVSSAWMIDTDSLNYLHDTYGVQSHQITREQWGTDSYTLYGGPPHYPYPASRNWVFIPDYTEQNPVMMIRQTVTDPLYNYGDTTSTYTSQPNDYIRGNRDFSYFKKLIDNAFNQQTPGFANIGLENSMDKDYQTAYIDQLQYIAKLHIEKKVEVILPNAVREPYQKEKVTMYSGKDDNRESAWITTPSYRVRLIKNKENIMITDLRIYSKELKDPYNSIVAKHEGYWVVPFLIDGSRWYETKDMEKYPHKFVPLLNDFWSNPTGYVLSQRARDYLITFSDNNEITVTANEGARIATFNESQFGLAMDASYRAYVPSQFPVQQVKFGGLLWESVGKNSISRQARNDTVEPARNDTMGSARNDTQTVLEVTQKTELSSEPLWRIWKGTCDELCIFEPRIQKDVMKKVVEKQYPYMYPEAVDRKLSTTYTRVTVSNMFALAGRNPIRLILEPHDGMNFPIILNKEAEITTGAEGGTEVRRLGELVKSQQQYVDLLRNNPARVAVNIELHQGSEDTYDIFNTTKTVYFAPNCKNDWKYCATHPIQGVWYIATKISDWWKGRR